MTPRHDPDRRDAPRGDPDQGGTDSGGADSAGADSAGADRGGADSAGADRGEGTGEPLLAVRGLVAGYDGAAVLHGVDLHVGAGEVVALLGANGAGKTTTLLAVSGLVPILGGSITVAGVRSAGRRRARPSDVVSIARRGVAHVPEDRGLFYDLTARENLELGDGGRRRRSSAIDLGRVLGWFPALRDVLDRRAGLLSGGEQQMVALGRALRSRPRLLMVDEMSLGLAPIVVESLLPVLRAIAEELGTGVLVVEQHVSMVLSVSDRAYLLDRGRIVLEGPADELGDQLERIEAGYLGETESDEVTGLATGPEATGPEATGPEATGPQGRGAGGTGRDSAGS